MRIKREVLNPVVVGAVVAAVIMAYVVTAQNAGPRAARASNTEALELLAARQPMEALLAFQEAVEAEPEFAEIHLNLALAYSYYPENAVDILHTDLPGVYREILRHLSKAQALSPGNLEIMRTYAYLALDAPQFGAEVDYERASRVWLEYLSKQRSYGDSPMTEYGILLRLARIEYLREGRDAAQTYLLRAHGMEQVLPRWTLKTPEEAESFVFRGGETTL